MSVGIYQRPDWSDTACKWGAYWTKRLMDKLPDPTIDLYGEDATRANSEQAIKANPDAFYYGMGHGNRDVFTGQRQEIVIDDENIALWAEAWVHLLSCEVFDRLGLKFPHGSGYSKTYYFYISSFPNSVAEQYFDSDHQYWLALRLKGATAGEAQAALKKAYTDYYAEGRPGNSYLPWDRDAHVISCDPSDRPGPVQGIKRVRAFYRFQDEGWTAIGDMTKGLLDIWSMTWRFPKEGVARLLYSAEDYEGNMKNKETGDFTIKFPESPIEITPISPKGGELIEGKSAELTVQVKYLG